MRNKAANDQNALSKALTMRSSPGPGYREDSLLARIRGLELWRGVRLDDSAPVLLRSCAKSMPPNDACDELRREFNVLQALHSSSFIARPLALTPDCLVLEDPSGTPLNDAQGPLPLARALRLGGSIADGLLELHAQGILHQDLQPGHVLVTAAGVCLLGFGLATRALRRLPMLRPRGLDDSLAYVAPEQTGRLARSADARSDLYALGAVLFAMLTGRPPFVYDDPLELLHAHLALAPPDLQLLRPGLPSWVAQIVHRLLAKNPEDRYQTARGVRDDLAHCLRNLTDGAPFPLGTTDIPELLRYPERLYGRETVQRALEKSRERAGHGHPELVLLRGPGGIGKSAVVEETFARVPIAKGKFDLLARDVPYGAFLAAIRDLLRRCLHAEEAELLRWKERLTPLLEIGGAVLLPWLPDLQTVVGSQPAPPELPPREGKARFQNVLRDLLAIFAAAAPPLVLFLDDMQWADQASLDLLEFVLRADLRPLLVIAAYRDDELSAAHPWRATLASLCTAPCTVVDLPVEPLGEAVVRRLLADMLRRPEWELRELAGLLAARTGGNPFFLRELIEALERDGMLWLDRTTLRWTWDSAAVRARELTDTVLELLLGHLRTLPQQTQRCLSVAACLGSTPSVAVLLALEDAASLLESLRQLVSEGFLVTAADLWSLELLVPELGIAFVHDRVQQAAYALLADAERPAMHLRLGRLLCASAGANVRERCFEVLDHFQRAGELLTDGDELLELAALALTAGRRAKAQGAFPSALEHLQLGLRWVKDVSWEAHYELLRDLHHEAAEVAIVSAEDGLFDTYATALQTHAVGPVDRGGTELLRVQQASARRSHEETVTLALGALGSLGIHLPSKPTQAQMLLALGRLELLRFPRTVEELEQLPLLGDPVAALALNLLGAAGPAAYFLNLELFALIALQEVELTLRHGLGPFAPLAFASYGIVLQALGAHDRAFAFAGLALRLIAKSGLQHVPRTLFVVHSFVQPWSLPLAETFEPLRRGARLGFAGGDPEIAVWCLYMRLLHGFVAGEPLAALALEAATSVQQAQGRGQPVSEQVLRMTAQTLANLQSTKEEPWLLRGDLYNWETQRPQHVQSNEHGSLDTAFGLQVMLHVLFQRSQEAYRLAVEGKAMPNIDQTFLKPVASFYLTLARLDLLRELRGVEALRLRAEVERARRDLGSLARRCPSSFEGKRLLVEAEVARQRGHQDKARGLFEQAIEESRRQHRPQEEGLAAERAAALELGLGRSLAAHRYLRDAREAYARWGARSKVQQLDRLHPELALRVSVPAREEIAATVGSETGQKLDLHAVLRAGQLLARETRRDRLLGALLELLVTTVGAGRGYLLQQREGCWYVEARLEGGAAEVRTYPADGTELALSVVHLVARSREPVVLEDAVGLGTFRQDPYVRQAKALAVLCLPVLMQDSVAAVLYLDNVLTRGAFTPERVEIAGLLASQAAISLENAQANEALRASYQHIEEYSKGLETLVADRTRELQASEASLRKAQTIAQVGSWEWDILADSVTASEEAHRILGVDAGTMSLSEFTAVVHQEDQALLLERMRAAVEKNVPLNVEYRILGTGMTRVVHAQGTLERPRLAEPRRIVGTLQDITVRKEAELALERANQLLTVLVAELADKNKRVLLLSVLSGRLQGVQSTSEVMDVAQEFLPQIFLPFEVSLVVRDEGELVLEGQPGAALAEGLIEAVNKTLGLAVANVRLWERLEMERDHAQVTARTDALTKLANRRTFDEMLSKEFDRLKREGLPLSLIMLDVDHFKRFNDTYGHVAGDNCLRQVAAAIQIAVRRPADIVARYGGEEFAVILPETDACGAAHVAERVRMGVEALGIPHATSDAAGHVTVSQGVVTVCPSRLTEPDRVVALADQALYKAKRGGRNRIQVVHDDAAVATTLVVIDDDPN
jgi:diguanylate cyclase (GGDEF)-like protein